MLDSEFWLFEESSDLDFPLPQRSLLLTCCHSRCPLFFFTGKGILFCYSIGTEALGRAVVSAPDRRQSQSCSGNLCPKFLLAEFLYIKRGQKGLQGECRNVVKSFYILPSSPSLPVLQSLQSFKNA